MRSPFASLYLGVVGRPAAVPLAILGPARPAAPDLLVAGVALEEEESGVTLRNRRAGRGTGWPRTLLVLVACAAAWTAPAPLAARAAETAETADDSETAETWAFEEFDWGDSPELVDESVRYSLPFTCNPLGSRCGLPVVEIDGEDLLVKFGYFEGLYRIGVMTPDLTPQVAEVHAGRVWKLLVDYVTRHKGEPERSAAELPAFDELSKGDARFTHHWSLEGQEIRVGAGRRDDGKIYIVASLFDPERAARRLEALRDGAPSSSPDGEARRPGAP